MTSITRIISRILGGVLRIGSAILVVCFSFFLFLFGLLFLVLQFLRLRLPRDLPASQTIITQDDDRDQNSRKQAKE